MTALMPGDATGPPSLRRRRAGRIALVDADDLVVRRENELRDEENRRLRCRTGTMGAMRGEDAAALESGALGMRGTGAAVDELERLYAEQGPRLRRVAAGILGDARDADDVVQDTFARALGRRRT